MHAQVNQVEAVQRIFALNAKASTEGSVNKPHCPAYALAHYQLRDQSVRISSPLIDALKTESDHNQTIQSIECVKNCRAIIEAFLDKGLGSNEHAQALTNAIKRGKAKSIDKALKTFLDDAMLNLMAELENHTQLALKGVRGLDVLLGSVKRDYSIYNLSIDTQEGWNASEEYKLTFQGIDFFQHLATGLYSIKDAKTQRVYKHVLEQSLKYGGIWQEDLVHIGFVENWCAMSEKDIVAAEKLLILLKQTEAKDLIPLLEKKTKIKTLKPLIETIEELMEFNWCEENYEDDEFKEWLVEQVFDQIEVNKPLLRLNALDKGKVKVSKLSSSTVLQQLQGLLKASKKHLQGKQPDSFELDEENMSSLSFVLQNDEENTFLAAQSQESYEYFCNAGEDRENYRINLAADSWLEDLKEMTLAMNILFVGIEAVLGSLPE